MQLRSFLSSIRKEYSGNLIGDLSGGLTTAVVALPLALAFAIASGVPARYGLYTAIVAGIVGAVFGGSKVQVSGPTGGMAAILIFVTTEFGYEKVVLIGFVAGLFQLAASAFKLGRLVKILPLPLVAGFTMGIGLVIFGGQIDHAFGIQLQHHHTEFLDRMTESLWAAFSNGVNLGCVALSLGTIVVTLLITKKAPRLPAALIAVVGASLVAWIFRMDVPYVKEVPRMLPAPHFPQFSWTMFRELLRPAATVAALGGIESLLAAVVADNILADGSKHNSNRELMGQGLANMAASMFGGIPCTGAIARTAVNIKSGGRTRLASVIHSVALILVMLFFAPLAAGIPIAALAGVLMVTAIKMVEWHQVRWLLKASKSDISILGITVFVTVFTDLVMAVEFGLATAMLLFIKRMSETVPQMVGSDAVSESKTSRYKVFRMPGPIFWGDSHTVIDAIEKCTDVDVVILKMQFVTHIDATGVDAIRHAKSFLENRGIKLYLVDVPEKTLHTLKKMGVLDEVKMANVFANLEAAKTAVIQCQSA